MEILRIPQLLLISGTGRNSGKTTLACNIIRKFSAEFPIIAIKISSHFHKNITCETIITNNEDLFIAEESEISGKKDSSRMLAAGARKSFFVMANDNQLIPALLTIQDLIHKYDYIICESGGLRRWVLPGVFLMLNSSAQESSKENTQYLKSLCDKWITFDGNNINFDLNTLHISNNHWLINNNL